MGPELRNEGHIRNEDYIDDFLTRLRMVWLGCPHVRFGQLLAEAMTHSPVSDLFSVPDETLARAVEHVQKRLVGGGGATD